MIHSSEVRATQLEVIRNIFRKIFWQFFQCISVFCELELFISKLIYTVYSTYPLIEKNWHKGKSKKDESFLIKRTILGTGKILQR